MDDIHEHETDMDHEYEAEAEGEVTPPAAPVKKVRPPYRFRRIPSFARLAFVSVTSLALGAGSLVAGLFYIRNVVPIAAERNMDTNPVSIVMEQKGRIAFPQSQERMNILVLGIDNNYDRKGIMYTRGARSDTMMVVSLSNEAKFLNVVSIPRDCYVLISQAYGYEKINAAYSFGGPKQAMETVEQLMGVPIHHYVVVKIKGAQKTLDALGGLPINVEKDMDYDDNWGHLHVHLKKGPQVLTGEQAVGYARFRHDEESDRGRIRRQQQVIRALVDRLKEPKMVMAIPGMAQAVKETLETDLQIPEMADLAHLYSGFDQKKMKGGQVEGNDTMIGGASMIIPYTPGIEKLVRTLLKDTDTMALHDMRIQVLNGSKEPGAAQRLADQLTADGLQVTRVELADKNSYEHTEIQEHTKNARLHGRLAGMLSDAKFSAVAAPKGQEFDFTIIVGNDKTLTTLHNMPTPPPMPPIPPQETRNPHDVSRLPEPAHLDTSHPRADGTRSMDDNSDPALRAAPRTPEPATPPSGLLETPAATPAPASSPGPG